jgi:hypothetical protein
LKPEIENRRARLNFFRRLRSLNHEILEFQKRGTMMALANWSPLSLSTQISLPPSLHGVSERDHLDKRSSRPLATTLQDSPMTCQKVELFVPLEVRSGQNLENVGHLLWHLLVS